MKTSVERWKSKWTAAVSWCRPLRAGVVVYALLSFGLAATLTLGLSWRLGALVLILSLLLGLGNLSANIVERYGSPLLERAATTTMRWLRERDNKLARSVHRSLAGLGVELPLIVLLAAARHGRHMVVSRHP